MNSKYPHLRLAAPIKVAPGPRLDSMMAYYSDLSSPEKSPLSPIKKKSESKIGSVSFTKIRPSLTTREEANPSPAKGASDAGWKVKDESPLKLPKIAEATAEDSKQVISPSRSQPRIELLGRKAVGNVVTPSPRSKKADKLQDTTGNAYGFSPPSQSTALPSQERKITGSILP